MDLNNKKKVNNYNRVMSRVYNRSCSSLKSTLNVTRHDVSSSVRNGAKPSGSNVGSGVFSELPIILNDYIPDASGDNSKRKSVVVKPRRTIRSMDPCESSVKTIPQHKRTVERVANIVRVPNSAPCISKRDSNGWSDTHIRQCFTSRSHAKLKDIKDEIKLYQDSEKLVKFKNKVFKTCGVVIDDDGRVSLDKAVQAEVQDPDDAHIRYV